MPRWRWLSVEMHLALEMDLAMEVDLGQVQPVSREMASAGGGQSWHDGGPEAAVQAQWQQKEHVRMRNRALVV